MSRGSRTTETERPTRLRIRTITAGVPLTAPGDRSAVAAAVEFLRRGRELFEQAGYEVQTIRLATPAWVRFVATHGWTDVLGHLQELDSEAGRAGALLGIGSLASEDRHDAALAGRAAELVGATRHTSFSVAVATPGGGLLPRAARTAAETMLAISRVAANGEENFRFAAAANVPPGTPFFPVAHHAGPESFALGLESATLVGDAFRSTDLGSAADRLRETLTAVLVPVQRLAERLARIGSRRFTGIDVSPAPGLDASIAAAVESLTGRPFGGPSTLAACAAVTQALAALPVQKCGYSGLMLPLLEDRILARRAAEDRFGLRDLLLYSSVCSTGLDVVPLPGGCSVDQLAGVILDVAALSVRLHKPLAARLLPVPGRRAGEVVDFANPHLTSSVIMPLE